MDSHQGHLSRKPSIIIPPSLMPYQHSSRNSSHAPEVVLRSPDGTNSKSIYPSESMRREWRRSWVNSSSAPIPIAPEEDNDYNSHYGEYVTSPTSCELGEASSHPPYGQYHPYQQRHTNGNTETLSEKRPAVYPHAYPNARTGLYTIYDVPSAANSRSTLQLDTSPYQSRGNSPSRPSSPAETRFYHEEHAGLINGRPRTRKRTLPSSIELIQGAFHGATGMVAGNRRKARNDELEELYEDAKLRGEHLKRRTWVQVIFQIAVYLLLGCFIYFVLVGLPFWKGAVFYLYKAMSDILVLEYGYVIFIGIAVLYAFLPLFILFEKSPPAALPLDDPLVQKTCLIIPCYKSAAIIENTIKAALKVFPAKNIFVIANGNSPTPLDNTAEIVAPYGVNHVWSPVGSKIVAQFVGCYVAEQFKYVLLIDDDCALPPNFPIVSDRITGKVKCVGYTIKSVGPNSSRGTLCQQAQDLEYKLSGLQRALAGKMVSATYAHGAISLWNRRFLIKTFHEHPGFTLSEDWFFGHVARKLGSRITMCTSVFVETETPSAVFFSSGGSRGGFGEMTIWKQRFYRWNFFFVNGIWYNLAYIIFSWKLGWWEFGAKLFVWQEIYETLLYILAPFVLPISFLLQPIFTAILMGVTTGIYLVNAIIFNEIHLRLKKERVTIICIVYYMFYKMVLTVVNIISCYWSIFKYAQYFAVRHPKVIEDEKVVEVVLNLDSLEDTESSRGQATDTNQGNSSAPLRKPKRGMSITAEISTIPAAYINDDSLRRSRSRASAMGRTVSVRMAEGRGGRGRPAEVGNFDIV